MATVLMSPAKYRPNPASFMLEIQSPHTHLVECLSHLLSTCPPSKPWAAKFNDGRMNGIFAGPTSIAYLFLNLAHSHPDLEISGKVPKDWCDAYLDCGQEEVECSTTRNCGVINEYLAYHAVKAAAHGVDADVDAVLFALSDIQTGHIEWLQGRAGALSILRIIQAFVPKRTDDVQKAMKTIITHMLSIETWTHFGKHLLGACHGDIGNITQIVLSDPSVAPKLHKKLDNLLDRQTERGNWYNSTDNDKELIQWCHGAPGFVICLRAIRKYFPDLQSRMDIAIQKAQNLTWTEGILVKEPNLCHGLTGNAMALDTKQMEHFLSMATPQRVRAGGWEQSSDPDGLLWGEAGRAWAWAALDGGKQGFPAFTDV